MTLKLIFSNVVYIFWISINLICVDLYFFFFFLKDELCFFGLFCSTFSLSFLYLVLFECYAADAVCEPVIMYRCYYNMKLRRRTR
ncbi:hypothetical protein KFK09_004933 [Dendrobium nobile]|uniref:Uncharacterized protein n=1 Tax=Dendrobium nobile TaxID=94219 RepID=A0A8T3BZ74_DENNO|nr:hypothetical protein KFK09_004933 [Dendrobium nobile]